MIEAFDQIAELWYSDVQILLLFPRTTKQEDIKKEYWKTKKKKNVTPL